MPQTEPTHQTQNTQDLFRSLSRSIQRLRQEAEDLQQQLAVSGEEALNGPLPRIAKLEGLIRDCQKVEKTLVEHTPQGLEDQQGRDLAAARAEVSSRLDRLRATAGAESTDQRVK